MFDFIYDFFNGLLDFLYRCLLTISDILKDVFFFIFETVINAVGVVLVGLGDFAAKFDVTQYFAGIPPEMSQVLGAIGLKEALGMISAALLVRLVLQLIPLVRLGS